MQEPSSKNKKGLYRLRRADPHERLSARLRHFSFGAAVVFVVAAAGIVIHSLYNIQIKNGATFRQYAAQQQLLDSTIQATRGRWSRPASPWRWPPTSIPAPVPAQICNSS